MKLAGQTALVTGAGTGIGRAIALALAREGARVAVNALHEESSARTAAEVRELGVEAVALPADVSRVDEVRQMFINLRGFAQTLDILVNNAGIGGGGTEAADMTDETWSRLLAVDLDSVFYCTREAIPMMEGLGRGRIINIASLAGLTGQPRSCHYAAAKGAVIGFTRAIARELAPKGIIANAVCPGWIDTRMVADAKGTPFLEHALTFVPAGRLGTPEEVASLVAYLASEDAAFLVGQTFSPNGGGLI